MTNTYFQELMAEFGCTSIQNTAFGAVGYYPFTAKLHGQQSAPIISVRFVVEGNIDACFSYLKENPNEYILWEKEVKEDTIFICTIEPSTAFYTKALLHTVFHTVKAVFPKFSLTAPTLCPFCNTPSPDAYLYWQQAYRPVHSSCTQNKLTLPEQDTIIEGTIIGSYLTGALGALLGAIIAVIPNFANAFSNGNITSILYVCIPFLSFLVYRALRGKASQNFASICIFTASLISAFALELVWFWLTLTSQYGETVSFWASTTFYFSTHNIGITIKEMFYPLLFLGIGFIPARILINRYTENGTYPDKIIRGAGFIRQTIFPISYFTNKGKTASK